MNHLTNSYLVPAVLLNPVILLHTANTILSRTLPSYVLAYSSSFPLSGHFNPDAPLHIFGPAATPPLVDLHKSDSFCWSYTMLMVGVQLVAFGRVQDRREARRVRRRDEMEKMLMETDEELH